MSLLLPVAETLARPLEAEAPELALPPVLPAAVVREIATFVHATAVSSRLAITAYGALLLALASDGSPRKALLLMQQAIFDAADEGPPCYEEDLQAVMALDDASIERTLTQLGYVVDDPPSAEPHRLAARESSEPAVLRCSAGDELSRGRLGGGADRAGCSARGVALASGGLSRGSGRSRSRSGLGRRYGIARALSLPRALPNVRRALDVPLRSF